MPPFAWSGLREGGAHIMNMKKLVLFDGVPLGVVVIPKASSSLSKHWVPVHTVCLSSVFSTSCMPGRCGPFWQMQFTAHKSKRP